MGIEKTNTHIQEPSDHVTTDHLALSLLTVDHDYCQSLDSTLLLRVLNGRRLDLNNIVSILPSSDSHLSPHRDTAAVLPLTLRLALHL